MNKIKENLKTCEKLGFKIHDDNRDVTISSPEAVICYIKWYAGEEFILRTVPESTESLENLEHEICFLAIEKYANKVSPASYNQLHKKAEENDIVQFVHFIESLQDFKSFEKEKLIKEVTSWQQDILFEIIDIQKELLRKEVI